MSSREKILSVIDDYFAGIYSGDVERLRSAFHSSAMLWGEIKGQPYYKSVHEYLHAVRNRSSPESLGEPYAMEPISIEIHDSIAFAKVRCRIFGYNYLDLLSFLYQDERWAIAAKVFTHLEE